MAEAAIPQAQTPAKLSPLDLAQVELENLNNICCCIDVVAVSLNCCTLPRESEGMALGYLAGQLDVGLRALKAHLEEADEANG